MRHRHLAVLLCRRIGGINRFHQPGPRRPRQRFRFRHVELRLGAQGQRLRRALRRLAAGQLHQRLDRTAREAQRHRRNADAEQTKGRETIERPLERLVADQADRTRCRHEKILHFEIGATGPAQPRHIPCVEQRDILRLEHHHAVLRDAFGRHFGLAVIADNHRTARNILRIARARAPLPAPADPVALNPLLDRMHRLAARREDAGRDRQRIAEHGARLFGRQKRRDDARRRADEDAPGGRTVGPRDPLDRLDHHRRMRLEPAIDGRDAEPVEPRLGEAPGDVLRQEAVGLDLGGPRRDFGGKAVGGGHGIDPCAAARLRLAHALSLRRRVSAGWRYCSSACSTNRRRSAG